MRVRKLTRRLARPLRVETRSFLAGLGSDAAEVRSALLPGSAYALLEVLGGQRDRLRQRLPLDRRLDVAVEQQLADDLDWPVATDFGPIIRPSDIA